MKGADMYYNIIRKAYKHNIDGIRKLNLKYGWSGGDSKAFLYKNVVFVTSSHARGKCFQIYLIDKEYDNDEQIKNNAFEVYGVINGQLGWTEEYGWIHKGSWVQKVMTYIGNLQSKTDSLELQLNEIKRKNKVKKQEEVEQQLNKFNEIFA